MTAATIGRVCWVDADWDRSRASDEVSRYAAHLARAKGGGERR